MDRGTAQNGATYELCEIWGVKEERDGQECLSYLLAGIKAITDPGFSQNVSRMRRIDFNLLS